MDDERSSTERSTEAEDRPVHNTLAGNAVVTGPVIQAGRIDRIVQHTPPPPVTPHQVPAPLPGFVNRRSELTELSALTAPDRPAGPPPVIVVTGISGVGKSQLVHRWVHLDLAELHPGGQLWTDLAELRRDGDVDPAAVLGDFLRALGVPQGDIPAGLGPRTRLYRSITAAAPPVLAVVENARHAAEVRPLVPAGGLAVVTSRTQLPGLKLDGAAHLLLDPLDENAGIELLRGWDLAAEETAAAELVRRCGGLPLALRAVGDWLLHRPHLRLDDAVRRLADPGRDGTHPELTGHRAYDELLAQLPADAQHLYRLIGALPGTTFTPPALAAALPADGAARLDDALGALLNAHLLAPAPSHAPRRFRLHELVHHHARTTAARDLPETAAADARRAHLDFYRDAAAHADRLALPGRFRLGPAPTRPLAELAGPEPLFTTGAEALDWLDAERANLLAVLRSAADDRRHAALWQLCESLWPLHHGRKHHADWIAAHRLGIEAAQWENHTAAETRLRSQLALAHFELGDHDRAQAELDALPAAPPGTVDPVILGVVLETRGKLALARGEHTAALDLFQQALDLNTAAADRHGTVVQNYHLAQAHLAAGDPEKALAALARARRTAEAADDPMLPRLDLAAARAYDTLDRPADAIAAGIRAAEQAAELGLHAKTRDALTLLVHLAETTGDEQLAAACRSRLDAADRTMGPPPPAS